MLERRRDPRAGWRCAVRVRALARPPLRARCRRRAAPSGALDERAEVLAARLEVGVLVEAGAGGREQHDRRRRAAAARGERDRVLEVAGIACSGTPGAAPARRPSSAGGLADQVDGAAALGDERRQRREVLLLAAAAGDQVDAARERSAARRACWRRSSPWSR